MKQERPTPESDAFFDDKSNPPSTKWLRYFRALERQRDEISDWLEAEHLLNDRLRKELEVVKMQRDEAIEENARLRAEDDRNNQLMVSLMAQRDALLKALDVVLDKGPNQ